MQHPVIDDNGLYLGKGRRPVYLRPKMANRHGLIAGATGTGKTVSLQILAEAFSNHGVPVFVSDVKGDLSGMALAGAENRHWPNAPNRSAWTTMHCKPIR